ncbi:hypothetical protein CLAIMM_02222 [Cladophialophora immunda]|nr:hypothetical protein CLAIMM_02222 [Cladophialophora immunda]
MIAKLYLLAVMSYSPVIFLHQDLCQVCEGCVVSDDRRHANLSVGILIWGTRSVFVQEERESARIFEYDIDIWASERGLAHYKASDA